MCAEHGPLNSERGWAVGHLGVLDIAFDVANGCDVYRRWVKLKGEW
jgi:hypothetical protein